MKKLLVSSLLLASFSLVHTAENKTHRVKQGKEGISDADLCRVLGQAAILALRTGYEQTRGTETFTCDDDCKQLCCGLTTCTTVTCLCCTGHPCYAVLTLPASFAVAKHLELFEKQPTAQATDLANKNK